MMSCIGQSTSFYFVDLVSEVVVDADREGRKLKKFENSG